MAKNREPLRILPIMLGVVAAASLAAALLFHSYYQRFGLEGATAVEGGGSATIIVLVFGTIHGLAFGIPTVLAMNHAPVNRIVTGALGLALFCAVSGLLGSMPTPTLEEWLQGVSWSFGFAAVAVGVATPFAYLSKGRQHPVSDI
jgi:hypothetical protein